MSNSDDKTKSGGSAGPPDNKGKLFDAARRGLFYECKELIINNKVDVNEDRPDRLTPFSIALKYNNTCICELLIEHGAAVNIVNKEKETPLLLASKIGNYFICDLLISHGADVNKVNSEGETSLCIAAYNNNLSLCELLVKHGANANIGRKWGVQRQTPLEAAASQGHYDVVDFLRWYTTRSISKDDRFLMIVVVLEELMLDYQLDASSLIDLLQMT
jgi:ankyrin repeat protein